MIAVLLCFERTIGSPVSAADDSQREERRHDLIGVAMIVQHGRIKGTLDGIDAQEKEKA